ncbi:NAD-dependent epimerase/dehydratase family protein [Chitinophaga deserti]|uniref:NAD-dependent epimerase/dehydratase family protein n=1 Tax=Chitinophaga deserti TaxID=2164099 RepID=UPI000D6A9C39|nr:NAD(P)-dependent oxidoreductase [Chitinophaga deserti]
MQNILIIGGSGFIGTNLVDFYLHQEGYNILNLDSAPPRNPAHAAIWQKADLMDKAGIKAAITGFDPDFVFHMAARTDLDERKSISGYAANIDGVSHLISALRQCTRLKRVIFTSSMLVCSVGYIPKNDQDYCPPNLYGESKVQTEKIIRAAGELPFTWCIIRPTSIWGPWFGTPYRDFFDIVMQKKYVKIGGKVAVKTFGFVGNAVYQIRSLLHADSELVHTKTFYIGDHPPLNINEWADEIAHQLHIPLKQFPLAIFKTAAIAGDLLTKLGIPFPITSFRLKNMQTDNIIPQLKDTYQIAPAPPYSMQEGISITLSWLKKHQ